MRTDATRQRTIGETGTDLDNGHADLPASVRVELLDIATPAVHANPNVIRQQYLLELLKAVG